MGKAKTESTFFICVNNTGYEVSLELRKLYEALPDSKADKLGQIRIIDEAGEDYLYPKTMFIAARLPQEVRRAILRVA